MGRPTAQIKAASRPGDRTAGPGSLSLTFAPEIALGALDAGLSRQRDDEIRRAMRDDGGGFVALMEPLGTSSATRRSATGWTSTTLIAGIARKRYVGTPVASRLTSTMR